MRLKMIKKSSASLKDIVSIRIGGTGDIFYPETINEFTELLKTHPQSIVIGGGSNVYFEDIYYQTPIIVTTKLTKIVKKAKITAFTGVRLANLFDFAAGTPATVGGALVSNYGAFGHEIGNYLETVEVFDVSQQKTKKILASELEFGYRTSLLKKNPQLIVLSATFKEIRPDLQRQEFLEKRKDSQPQNLPNSGSIFKNPKQNSAGKLIEECQLKGHKVGDASVWQGHANIIVNQGQATAENLQDLITEIKATVSKTHNINLEEEVVCKSQQK